MKKKTIIIIISGILLILFDLFTKYLITKYFNVNEGIVLINNFLKFVYIRNTGAAFGMLSNNTILLILVTIVLLFYLVKEILNSKANINLFAYTLIISGAIGNLIDRVFRKYVVDFISFKLLGHEMAIFNIADIYITFGIIIIIYCIIKEGRSERVNSKQ
jgi:signal peptidase II